MDKPIVKTNYGDLQGLQRTTESGKTFYSFKGIPFAEPPLGDLRFKDPIPVKPWEGIKDASKDGNICSQLNMMTGFELMGEEDCLYLNVYTPDVPDVDKKLPVMVYIHGGGFRMGSGIEEDFTPEMAVENGAILVSMNYRVGILGFLSLDIPEVPGNAGLKDQHLAIKWVKENIKFFGGDDDNITLIGLSAGGASVEFHLLYKKSENLFNRAVAQAGSSLCPWALNSNPKKLVQNVANLIGITAEDPYEILNQLNKRETKELLDAAMKAVDDDLIRGTDLFGFGPVIETVFDDVNAFLTEKPIDMLRSGNYLKIPTIYDLARDEGSMFKMFYNKHIEMIKSGNYVDYMWPLNLKVQDYVNKDIAAVYRASCSDERKEIDAFLSDHMMVAPIYMSLTLRSRYESHNYCFIFSYFGNKRYDFSAFGIEGSDETQHGAILPYMTTITRIKLVDPIYTPSDTLVRNYVRSIFVNYAADGNPTSTGALSEVEWRPIDGENFTILDVHTNLSVIPFPWKERMELWKKFYQLYTS